MSEEDFCDYPGKNYKSVKLRLAGIQKLNKRNLAGSISHSSLYESARFCSQTNLDEFEEMVGSPDFYPNVTPALYPTISRSQEEGRINSFQYYEAKS